MGEEPKFYDINIYEKYKRIREELEDKNTTQKLDQSKFLSLYERDQKKKFQHENAFQNASNVKVVSSYHVHH